jgi:hypothetical protein
MVSIELVSKHLQLQPTVPTCQNFFDRSSLRSTGARDQKKSSQFMSFYFWFIDFLFRRQLHSIHGADGDPGVLFPQNCFFDITFVFGFVEWDAPKFSMAFTKLDDRVLAFYQVLLLGFCSFLPPSVLATARTRNHKTLGALGGIKIQGFPTNSQKERKMEDAGCSGLTVFSLLSFST